MAMSFSLRRAKRCRLVALHGNAAPSLPWKMNMMVGAWIVRTPAPGWKPAGFVAPAQPKRIVTTGNVFVYEALFGTRYVGVIHGLLITA
jgi:hypothetical protein